MFSSEFYENFKNIFFTEHLLETASGYLPVLSTRAYLDKLPPRPLPYYCRTNPTYRPRVFHVEKTWKHTGNTRGMFVVRFIFIHTDPWCLKKYYEGLLLGHHHKSLWNCLYSKRCNLVAVPRYIRKTNTYITCRLDSLNSVQPSLHLYVSWKFSRMNKN